MAVREQRYFEQRTARARLEDPRNRPGAKPEAEEPKQEPTQPVQAELAEAPQPKPAKRAKRPKKGESGAQASPESGTVQG